MANFGMETRNILAKYNYSTDDIDWIGCDEFQVDQDKFWEVAHNSNYNAGYGRPEMPGDIIIMMKDGTWFKRHEYDGSEWWIHVVPPMKPAETRKFNKNSFVWRGIFAVDDWASSLREFCENV